MKNKYKEIFDNIAPDADLINSVTEINEDKQKNAVYKPILAFGCLVIAVLGIGAAMQFNFMPKILDEKDVVNLIVAYETRKWNESSQHISKKISGGGKTITIDADVVIEGNADEMCIYEAKESIFSKKEFEAILYGENGLFTGVKERGYIGFPTGSGITFNASEISEEENTELASRGEGYAKGCDLSYDEARKIADEFVERKKAENYLFVEGKIAEPSTYGRGYSSTGTGFYVFQYYQYVDGFPLETVTANVYNGVASELRVFVNDEGITYIRMCGLDLTLKKELNGAVISVESAIEMIEKSLPDLWLSEYAPIVEIRLEYILDQFDGGTYEVVPCWHFCIDQTEIKSLSIEEQRENDTNDLCVNAVTGEMLRVGDRYPVYQTENGIISTWGK